MNLDQIGNGTKAVVLVYDLNLSASHEQTEQMNEARERLKGKAHFLIAQIGDPRGDQFTQHFNASAPELFIFDGKGKLIDRKVAVVPAGYLIQKILE